MNEITMITGPLVVGLCSRLAGWPGFFGSMIGQILFVLLVAYKG